MMQPLFGLEAAVTDASATVLQLGENAWASFVGTLDALTMFYQGTGIVLIEVATPFARTPGGVVSIEETSSGGKSWIHRNCTKVGRGVVTSVSNSGPCRFRTDLVSGGKLTGIRIRAQDTREMEPIDVAMTFAGYRHQHTIRALPTYVIVEAPDIRDLYN